MSLDGRHDNVWSRVLGSAASGVAAGVDHAAKLAVTMGRGPRSRAERLSHDERVAWLDRLARAYQGGLGDDGAEVFFPEPAPAALKLSRVRTTRRGGEVVDGAWHSGFVPFLPEMGDSYRAHVHNGTAHARLYLHPGPRPAVILLHGYLGGHWSFEELVWPIRWLYAGGLDVAVMALPFHGRRARPGRRKLPPFPGADVRLNVEAFRHTMHDVRALLRWLKARGAPSVGALGMSLGGYNVSLLATLERDLAFAVPIIPLACVADFARSQGRLGRGDEIPVQHGALRGALHVVSPFARPSLLAPSQVRVIAATHDRITPLRHAERLAEHFGVELSTFPGGHLVQVGLREALASASPLLGL